MASTPPPPEALSSKPPPNNLRTLGILFALSAPISGFLLWIVVAVVVGEDRLEGESGQTAVGFAVLVSPVVIGLAVAAWAHFAGNRVQVSASTIGASLLVAGIALGLLGLFSGLTSQDASIGGGLLVIAGIVLGGSGAWVLRAAGRR